VSPDASPEPEKERFVEDRRRDAQRYDAICDQVIAMNELVKELVEKIPQGTVQEVHYKTEGAGLVGVISATICVMVMLSAIVVTILVAMEIHDMKAWQDQLRQKMARLEATIQEIRK
jgi:uncharacterized membrane protein